MDAQERKKRLEERIEKAEQKVKNSREELKNLKQRMRALSGQLTKKQKDSIKIWHGIACLSLMKDWPELNDKIMDYLEKNVKSSRQRKLMGLSVQEEKKSPHLSAPKKDVPRKLSEKDAVRAYGRIDLVVPYPEPAEARQEVKALGARWDGRVWYVEKGFDLRLVEKYLPKNIDLSTYAWL